jgi:AcrR family transcriptional regulator
MKTTAPPADAGHERARNKRGEGKQLREDIVRAALDLLDENGDAAAITLRAIARRIGISAPSIYSHFADRQGILLAAVQRAFEGLDQHLRGVVEGAGENSVARLLAMCEGYLEFARTRPKRYLVMFGGVWNAEQAMADATVARDDVAALGLATLDQLTALMKACVADDGRSQSTDPATDAAVLWVAMHGLAHQRIVATAFPWPAEIGTRLVRRLAYLR